MSNLETRTQAQITRPAAQDRALLSAVVDIVKAKGAATLALPEFSPDSRPADRAQIIAATDRVDELAQGLLQRELAAIRPQARWIEDEEENSPELRPRRDGEWWDIDDLEGIVNYIQGTPEWATALALVRDNSPVLAVVYQPIGDLLYTAVRGGGAYLNGERLRVSAKTELNYALAITTQTSTGNNEYQKRLGDSVTAMLERALLVRMFVPMTFPLLQVAAGQADVFWHYPPMLTGLSAGALLVAEAGGVVTDTQGRPWHPDSFGVVAATPGVHAAALDALSGVS